MAQQEAPLVKQEAWWPSGLIPRVSDTSESHKLKLTDRVSELVNVSFAEHVRLAEEHGGKDRWGWRFVGCGSWEGRGELNTESGSGVGRGGKRKSLEKTLGLDGASSRKAKGIPDDLDWVKENLTDTYSPMAPAGDTAQVHPYLFTTSMLDLAKEQGVSFVAGKVTLINTHRGQITGVSYTTPDAQEVLEMPATHVIVCAGAWSPTIVPRLPISATRAHSITVQPLVDISPYVLFTEITLPSSSGKVVSPEIYARPDSEIYICGPGDDSPLPATVEDVEVDEDACESIRIHASSISQEIRESKVDKRQACFLPLGGPIIGAADKVAKGLYIATGHTCWVEVPLFCARAVADIYFRVSAMLPVQRALSAS